MASANQDTDMKKERPAPKEQSLLDQLSDSSQLVEQMLADAGTDLWEFNFSSDLMVFGCGGLVRFGFPPEQTRISRVELKERIIATDFERMEAAFQSLQQGTIEAFSFEYRTKPIQGPSVRVCSNGRVLEWNVDGSPLRICGVNRKGTINKETPFVPKHPEDLRDLSSHMANAVPNLMSMLDTDGRYLVVNQAYAAMFDRPAGDFIGQSPANFTDEETYLKKIKPRLDRAAQGETIRYDTDITFPKKGLRRMHAEYTPVWTENGTVSAIVAYSTDITEKEEQRVRLEQANMALEHSRLAALNMMEDAILAQDKMAFQNELFQSFMDSLPASIFFKDTEGRFISVNKTFGTVNKFAPKDLIGKTAFDIMTPEDAEKSIKSDRQVMQSREVMQQELFVNGYWWLVIKAPRYDESGKLAGCYGFTWDITERKNAEAALRKSEDTRREWLANSPVCTKILDLDFNLKYMSDAGVKALQIEDVTTLYGKPYPFAFFPKAFCASMKKDLQKAVESDQSVVNEGCVYGPDGNEIWFNATINPVKDDLGQLEYIMVISTNVTERKETETELLRLSTAIEQSPETIVITDLQGSIQYVNPTFEMITGYTRDEAVGQNPRLLKSEETNPSLYEELWKTIEAGHVWKGRLVNKRKNGAHYTEDVIISPVKDAEGIITNYVAIKRDITEELVRKEEFRQAQKMEAVGQLAGGIAHDFNNILQGIQGFSEMLKISLAPDSEEFDNANEIKKAAKRAAGLTQQLLTFSRKQPALFTALDLNTVIQDSRTLLDVLLGDINNLELDLQEELPLIQADHGQWSQIIMNLAVNARDAMPKGGHFTLTTRRVDLNPEDAARTHGAEAGTYTCLSVTDTGLGMDRHIIDRLFEPFFTTKNIGAGTGLGLSVVYGIVKQCKGWINVYSEPDQGSCFSLYVPALDFQKTEPMHNAKDPISIDVRILLIEDDPNVEHLMMEMLTQENFNPTAAASAEEGLTLFKKEKGRFDLLISDMMLPGMRGDELADALRTICPTLPVLLYSGYHDPKSRWPDLEKKKYYFKNKPFLKDDLISAIKEVLSLM